MSNLNDNIALNLTMTPLLLWAVKYVSTLDHSMYIYVKSESVYSLNHSLNHDFSATLIISGSFAKNDQQLQASYDSSPPCTPDSSATLGCELLTILCTYMYGVALVSRIDKIIGLFCKRAL